MNEELLVKLTKKYLSQCRPGDFQHALRVVDWVKRLGANRDDLDQIVVAAYIHDIGWYKVLDDHTKLSKDQLLRYEPQANANTKEMVKIFFDEFADSSLDITKILRLINAADQHKSSLDDEEIIVDADNLSKLDITHVYEKYQMSEWMKMYELWEATFSERLKTNLAIKLYPGLLQELNISIQNGLQIFNTYQEFITKVYSQLDTLKIDISEFIIDHLGFQASSADDFESKVRLLAKRGEQLSESIVSGRRVAIFKLIDELVYKNQKFNVVEVFEPTQGQLNTSEKVLSAWEHIEFLLPKSIESLVESYPQLKWDTAAINRDEFSMVALRLSDTMRVKFPRLGVVSELKRQNQ